MFILQTETSAAARALAQAAWKLQTIAEGYRSFIDWFTPLDEVLGSKPDELTLDDADALVARTLLIHQFRRIVLRDPGLPTALLPVDWPGHAARSLAARIYRRIAPAAEIFLSARAQNENGPLPRPEIGFGGRFDS